MWLQFLVNLAIDEDVNGSLRSGNVGTSVERARREESW